MEAAVFDVSKIWFSFMKEISWVATTFSKILDKNGNLEMGLKLLKTAGSREGFFYVPELYLFKFCDCCCGV